MSEPRRKREDVRREPGHEADGVAGAHPEAGHEGPAARTQWEESREEGREEAPGEGREPPGPGDPAPPQPYGATREELERLRLPRDGRGAVRGRRRGLRRAGAALAVLLLVLAGYALWRLANRPLEAEVVVATPLAEVAGQPVPILSGSGYLVPAQPFIAVGSRVSGRIERYRVDEGDRVEQGQALVELEPTPFRASVDQARAALASAEADLGLARAELERAERLFEAGVISADELDRRRSRAQVTRARVRELRAALERAETDFADSVIRAPTDGVVLETFKQPGEIAVPGGFAGSGDLLRLANLSELRAELDVNEADLPRVSAGQPAEVIPDAFPEARYAGRVVELSPQIDRQKGTREVEVVVLEPDERLLPDMSVRVVFLDRLPEPAKGGGAAAVVPRTALRRDEGGSPFLWVVRDGRAARVPVEPGEDFGDQVVVRGGLSGGERVILGEGPGAEGVRVRVVGRRSERAGGADTAP